MSQFHLSIGTSVMLNKLSILLKNFFPEDKNYKLLNEKFFTRMYWQVYEDASDEWKENEQKFGKEWPERMQAIQEAYMEKHPQRMVIEGAVRIR